jgi:hypothetical protein
MPITLSCITGCSSFASVTTRLERGFFYVKQPSTTAALALHSKTHVALELEIRMVHCHLPLVH